MRYLVRLSSCTEGQSFDPILFSTDSLEKALACAAIQGLTVFDKENNYAHVIA